MSFGYIVLRHVNSHETNKYWQECLRRIKLYDPDAQVIVIDDNSFSEYIEDVDFDYELYSSESNEKGCAELLPYIFLLRHEWFEKAVIIQDSVFLNAHLRYDHVHDFEFFWSFKHEWNNPPLELDLISALENSEILEEFYRKVDRWNGGFGAMCCVNLSFLREIDNRFQLNLLKPFVRRREERMAFERIIGLLFCLVSGKKNQARFGDLHANLRYNSISFKEVEENLHLPLIKCWTGRVNYFDGAL